MSASHQPAAQGRAAGTAAAGTGAAGELAAGALAAVELAEQPSRYVVGMDLGTTNSAVAYVDTHEKPWRVRVLAVPQLVAPGQVEARETLPSFHYQPAVGEVPPGALKLPWHGGKRETPANAVGLYARDQGALMPGRLVSSAKSWLCHAGVDRRADILPWHAADDVDRLSPVEASGRYLQHVREAWNAAHPADPLERQDFVLTLPASFDEVARELTVEAAARAGLPRVVLIEEPQAAFYAWLNNHAEAWESLVSPGQKILVCDVGGGTSDFTLIRVRRGESGKVQFHRVAVGEHLILGGDNLDLALAHHLEQRLQSNPGAASKLSPRQWDVLVRACRRVKEELLGQQQLERFTVNLPGSGSRLIGGSLQLEVTRDEVRQILIDGFFPLSDLNDRPQSRRSGFQEFGLPFATDPAISRHLSSFLVAHRFAGLERRPGDGASSSPTNSSDGPDPARPDVLLFNGGVFESSEIRTRLIAILEKWFRTPAEPNWTPQVLANDRLDLAVARGAAYYGMVRRGEGVKITANLARSYYLGFDSGPSPPPASDAPESSSAVRPAASTTTAAVCVLPGSAEPGQDYPLTERRFELLVSQPVEFPLYVSSTRLDDRAGELVSFDSDQMRALPPIRTALKTRRRADADTAPVQLHARLTEIGTVDLWCAEIDGPRTWRLQFDVRSATQTDLVAHESQAEREGVLDEGAWSSCRAVLDDVFGPEGKAAPDGVVKRLIEAVGLPRDQWPTSLLRRIGETLLELDAGRRRSPVHEARWLNLLGYTLRPGYGLAVDDWRVAETWKLVQGRLGHGAPTSRTESLILWRRIAGGLSAGQQRAVAEPLLAPVRALHRRMTTGKDRGSDQNFSPHESTEVWRLLGSLELLPVSLKSELGRMVLDLLPRRKLDAIRPALAWALGRVGARQGVYGPLNTVVSPDTACQWLERLLETDDGDSNCLWAATLLARRTGDRYRDVPDEWRERVLGWLDRHGAKPHYVQLVAEVAGLDADDQARVFGESLPRGLRLV